VVITTLVLGFFAQASPLDTSVPHRVHSSHDRRTADNRMPPYSAASVSKNNKYDIKWCKKEHYKNCYEYEDLYTDRCC